jgi:hypothetical protein
VITCTSVTGFLRRNAKKKRKDINELLLFTIREQERDFLHVTPELQKAGDCISARLLIPKYS